MSMVLPNTWRFRSGIPEKIELSTFQNGCFCPAEAAQGGRGPQHHLRGDRQTHSHSLCTMREKTTVSLWTAWWRTVNNFKQLWRNWAFEQTHEESRTTQDHFAQWQGYNCESLNITMKNFEQLEQLLETQLSECLKNKYGPLNRLLENFEQLD